jgi:Ca2+-transporting ATPase
MVYQTAFVAKLPAIETLGCTSVIFSGKTRTVTTNEMTVNVFSGVTACDTTVFGVEGISYRPEDNLKAGKENVQDRETRSAFQASAKGVTLGNDAGLI